ncbi:PAS/PAC sensor hybrid histidine kinase [Magnetococcus marinus MC-1]|uniref:histidine kinase n=1 Tax=Magnetococcus marinus (strain ATCC BAA-1437 / JCM 17883 / MC-1) TaxID=156889 RepID=A0L6G0_MAGMM|nr:PAS domain S-box protein [Magnetococcus marinus]ABK43553.1 PAS/PAC sensor hybrid histidine kinase [Magnetococcus marinus MC-1]
MSHPSRQERELAQRFQTLRMDFLAEIPPLCRHLDRLVAEPSEGKRHRRWHCAQWHARLQGVVGSCATFECRGLRDLAQDAGNLLQKLARQDVPPQSSQQMRQELRDLLAALQESAQLKLNEPELVFLPKEYSLFLQEEVLSHTVLAFSHDARLLEQLGRSLASKGYRLVPMPSYRAMRDEVVRSSAAAVLVDLEAMSAGVDEGDIPGLLCQEQPMPMPLLVLGGSDNMDHRLCAVRLGSTAFRARPIAADELARQLIAHHQRHNHAQRARVLIMDDNEPLGRFYQMLLELAEMEVVYIREAEELLPAIQRFKPEVLLLDLYMPDANGLEIAAVVRQSDSNADLPILLMVENNAGRRILDQTKESESFLIKPVQPGLMVRAVIERVRQRRQTVGRVEYMRSALHELEQLQLALNQHAIVSVTDQDGNITFVNQKFCQTSGYTPNELIGNNHRMLKSDQHPASFYQEMWATITQGQTWHGQVKNRRKNGTTYWVSATIVPFLDGDGTPREYISVRTDVTAQKAAQERYRASEQRLRAILDNTHEGVVVMEASGQIEMLNPAAARIFGYTLADMPQPTIQWLLPEFPLTDILNDAHLHEGGGAGDVSHANLYREMAANRSDGSRMLLGVSVSSFHLEESAVCVAVVRDITARKMEEIELKQAKEVAERASAAKTRFLSSMSHELRTPMNAILGFAQVMQSDPNEPLSESQRECTREIIQAGGHLLELINDVLDLAKIEENRISLKMAPVHVQEVIREAVALVTPMANRKGIRLYHGMGEGVCERCDVQADRTRLKQILINLATNGVKYNREGGEVEISCRLAEAGRARIEVRDTGIGIAALKQGDIFEPFHRLVEDGTIEGTGIGLSIVKRLVEAMGGTLGLESQEGQGSRFWFQLPNSGICSPTKPHASLVEPVSVRQVVLYVESNPVDLQLMSVLMRRYEHLRLDAVRDLEVAQAQLQQGEVDLLLINIGGGVERCAPLFAWMQQTPHLKALPVIAISADDEVESGVRNLPGSPRFMQKPLDLEPLIAHIGLLLEKPQAREA